MVGDGVVGARVVGAGLEGAGVCVCGGGGFEGASVFVDVVVGDRVVGAPVVGAVVEGAGIAGFNVEVASLLGALCGRRWS
jgi:hypothetical protein